MERYISDFQKLYVGLSSSKPAQKTANEPLRRGHKGLIVHISSPNNNLRTGKMNFVDLAGYRFNHITVGYLLLILLFVPF